MATPETVKEVLARIRPAKEDSVNRFSKKSFNSLLRAMLNDLEFAEEIAVVKGKELQEIRPVLVTKDFRKFLRKILEKAGMDAADSGIVMDPTFTIDNVDGFYEFIDAVLYEYMSTGNNFEFGRREDFRGSMTIKQKKESTKITEARNPKDGKSLGMYETHTKAHRTLVSSSPAPEYLKYRKPANK